MRIGSVAAVAVPVFFLGLTLQILFAGKLGWLPLQGRIDDAILLDAPFRSITGFYLLDSILSGNFTAFSSAVRHLILPVLTLALASMATIIRITRSMMIEALQQDYIRSARAYGIPQHNIHYLYALKATLIPLLTVVGLTYGFMLGGSIIVEYVFDWPGVGGYMVQALLNNDFTAVMGVTFFVAFAYLIINLIIDLIYQALDPRLKKIMSLSNQDISIWKRAGEILRFNRLFTLGLLISSAFLMIALLAPVLASVDPHEIDFKSKLEAPSLNHWFGTDALGRGYFFPGPAWRTHFLADRGSGRFHRIYNRTTDWPDGRILWRTC